MSKQRVMGLEGKPPEQNVSEIYLCPSHHLQCHHPRAVNYYLGLLADLQVPTLARLFYVFSTPNSQGA